MLAMLLGSGDPNFVFTGTHSVFRGLIHSQNMVFA